MTPSLLPLLRAAADTAAHAGRRSHWSPVPSLLPLFVIFIVIVAQRPATRLRRKGAVSPETALPRDQIGMTKADQRRFERLLEQGLIREGPTPGTYYYDAAGQRAKMRRTLPIVLGVIVVLSAVIFGVAWWLAQRRAP
jgi:hypothetical protein